MTISAFESTGTTRGVLALELVGVPDWGGLIVSSFDTTNTPDVSSDWQSFPPPLWDVDATVREATRRYDNLLRRLAD